ncbi:CotH kinase family protein [Pedobacter sp. L105]|uniref:CotH kinase family protein n=1 Tax=Pedobacter sp. L105 TaxID=1641871 RepID=UPI00131E0AD2|nr:CotH kinase family protein [Pedobacter sp. L105]
MAKIYLGLISLLLICGCKKDKSIPTTVTNLTVNTTSLTSVTLEAKNNKALTADVVATINGDQVNAVVPYMQNDKKLVLTFTAKDAANVTVNDTVQVSGTTLTDFTKPVSYKLTSAQGSTKTYTITIRNFTGLPILYLTTAAPVVSKDDYVTGSLIINANSQFDQVKQNIALSIKGHGNSTWLMPKKPYRLKFNSKGDLLGMPAAKNWVLLANYDDKTLLRNRFALDLGTKIGADFTPQSRFVEVVMNGVYQGNYLLTSLVEVDPNRVNISELNNGDTPADQISGGYLLEIDVSATPDEYGFRTAKNLLFTIQSPDVPNADQQTYIHNYVQQTEDALFSANFTDTTSGYAKYINSDSFVNYYLVEELMKNNDAVDWSSIYYYKDVNGKLGMGPIWDFDVAAGNVNYSDAKNPTGWWVQNAIWFNRLFQDPAFKQKVKTRWKAIKNNQIVEVMNSIDTNATYLDLSEKQNFTTWPILNVYVWPNQFVLGTYPAEVAELKKWLNERISWMDGQISAY